MFMYDKNTKVSISANNNNKPEGKGEAAMKNSIKERRAAELEAKKQAEKEAAKKARLEAIEPVDIVGTMDEVTSNEARSYRDEDGRAIGTNRGKLYQKPIILNGQRTTIAAETPEALAAMEEAVANGLSGDGKFHKIVYINGKACDCAGSTPEELEADIAAAEDYAQKHIKGDVITDIDVAEQLVDAGYKKEDTEEIKVGYGRYILSYDGKYIMKLGGETVANLEDISSELSRKDIKTILLERLNKYLEEEAKQYECCCDDDDEDDYDEDDEYEDYEYDGYEYPCDNEYNDDPCNYCRYYDDCQNPRKTRY